jgi:mono/diheme cytochrome c family protein
MRHRVFAVSAIVGHAPLSAARGGVLATLLVEPSLELLAQAPSGQVRAPAPPGEALFTSAQAMAGKASYDRNCANCHRGRVDDGTAPSLRATAFLQKYSGKPAADLFGYASAKMPAPTSVHAS